MPEELEKHLILNSNRLRTFEDARLEVVTYEEAKFGLRSILSRLAKEKGHQVRVICVLSAGWSTFSTRLQCTQEHRQVIVWQGMVQE